MLPRGDLCIVSCRSGKSTAHEIGQFLADLCRREGEVLQRKKNKAPLTPEERRSAEFVQDINAFGVDHVDTDIYDFNDGETFARLKGSVRGKDVFIVQNMLESTNPERTNSNIMELLIVIDAVNRSGARHISTIIPYFSYCKQERRRGREAISASLMVRLLETAGVDSYIVTFELHSSVMKGFSDPNIVKIENLYASTILIEYFKNIVGPEDVFAAPDAGAAKMVQHYSKVTGREMVLGYKYRPINEKHIIDEQRLLGDVDGKKVVIIDDQIASGGTMGGLAERAKEHGAKEVHVGVTHGPLFEGAEEKLRGLYDSGKIDSIVTTDTIQLSPEFLERNSFIKVLSITGILGQAIYELHIDGSVKKLYDPLLRKELFGL